MHGVLVLAGLAFTACEAVQVNVDSVYTHDGGEISGGDQWLEGTHVVNGSITVTNGVLEVAPCSIIQMAAGANIDVENGGALKLVGTADCPIVITSANAAPTPGDWGTIDLYSTSDNANNVFDYVTIEYGGDDTYGVLWAGQGSSFAMTNSIVQHNKSRGVELEKGVTLRQFSNNTLTDNGTVGIGLYADEVGQLGAGTYTPNGVEGVEVFSDTIDHDQTWLDLGTRYLVQGDLDVDVDSGSAVLTLSPGVTLAMAANAGIAVSTNGAIHAVGTATAPITFTSAKSTPVAGDWSEIDVYGDSMPSQFDYAVIEYGGAANEYGQLWVGGGAHVSVTNSTLRDGGFYGVDVESTGVLTAFAGNTVTDNAKGPVRVYPNGIGMLDAGLYWPNGVDAITVWGGTVTTDATWHNLEVPYTLVGSVSLDAGTTGSALVDVDAGTVIEMAANTSLIVSENGGLSLNGTDTDHVTITSAKAYPSAGDWTEIDVYATSMGAYNYFAYTDISYAGGGSDGQLWLASGAGLTLDNVTFVGSGCGCDVYFDAGNTVPSTFTASSTTYDMCIH